MFRHLDIRRQGAIERVTLNRPEVRNAFNERLITELAEWATAAAADPALRVVVLGGAGPVFSAGADLGWMAEGLTKSRDEVLAESQRLHDLFEAIDGLPQAVIARVQGAAVAGGIGLVSVCDVVVAADDAQFGFSEVRLGIVPAIISPFVLAKIGAAAARELFVTGARFPAARARELGLVSRVVPAGDLDLAVEAAAHEVLRGSPGAVAAAKRLVHEVAGRRSADAFAITGPTIAARRLSDEGRAGVEAFLARRAPPWV